MRFSVAATAIALAGVAAADGSWGNGQSWGSGWPPANGTGPAYVTETVTAFTTYCPAATVITHNSQTYTVTSATTLTITNCPCTITKPVTTSVYTSCPSSAPAGTAPVSKPPPPPPASGVVPPPASGTAPGTPVVTSSPSTSPITPAKGAGNQLSAGVAGVLAVVGLVAAL